MLRVFHDHPFKICTLSKMKRTTMNPFFLLSIASVMMLTALPLSAKQASTQLVRNLDAGKQQTLVTFGTSLTAVGAWVDQIATVLNQQYPGQCTVINGAQGGANSDWGVKSLDEKVLKHKPDTVLIEFAVNDAVSKRNTSVEHARNNLNQIIDRILAQNPQCEIILQVMNVPVAHTRTGRTKLDAFNQMYRDVAKERDYQLIDHWPNWKKLLNEDPLRFHTYNPDTIHPVRDGALNVITPHLIKELGLATTGHPEKSTATPCWNYLLHVARQDKKNPDTTRADYDTYWEKSFSMSDLNKDGSVDADEMQAAALLKALDRDQSGTVRLEEWLVVQAPQFKAFDKDNNGSIDKKEKTQLAGRAAVPLRE